MNALLARQPVNDRDRCGGTRRDGLPCRNPKGHRTAHPGYGNCSKHGGSTPNGITHARRLVAEEAVATFGLPRDVDPHTALLEEVHAVAGNVAYLRTVVGADNLTQRVFTDSGSYEDVSVWAKLYWGFHDRLVRVSAAAIKAGVEERRVQLAEEHGRVIAQVLKATLVDLGVSDHPDIHEVVARHLRALPSADPA